MAATGAAAVVAVMTFVPAGATPGPHPEEWWFSGWQIQSKVWPLSKGDGVTVAIIDSGVNASLPELSGVVLPGTDLEGAGDGRTDRDPGQGHGTGMAALIASQGGPTGWVGIAPDVRILPIVSQYASIDNEAKAIHYAVDHHAGVINMSQGVAVPPGIYPSNCPPALQQAIIYAANHDVVIVASAGNSGSFNNVPQYPGACAGVLTVGALDGNSLRPWADTQRQSYVAAAAPGAKVGSVGKDGELYHYGAGTSQATALTSAVVALVRARFPNMPARQVVQRILNTTKDVGPKGRDKLTGMGLVLPYFAMTRKVRASAPNPVYERLDRIEHGKDQVRRSVAPPGTPGPGASSGGAALSLPVLGLIGLGLLVVLASVVLIPLLVLRGRRSRTPVPAAGKPPWGPTPPAPPAPPPTITWRQGQPPAGAPPWQDPPGGPPPS